MSTALDTVQNSISIRAWVLDRVWPAVVLAVALASTAVWIGFLAYGMFKLGALLL